MNGNARAVPMWIAWAFLLLDTHEKAAGHSKEIPCRYHSFSNFLSKSLIPFQTWV